MRRLLTGLMAMLPMPLLLVAAMTPAAAQAPNPTITAIVEAASVDNSVSILITNANAFSSLRDVSVSVASRLRYVENVRIEPPSIAMLPPNGAEEVMLLFDISFDVPEAGARETVDIAVEASEGILDHNRLTLNLGITTPETVFAIVPFVVGKTKDEAERLLTRSLLDPQVERLERPSDPALFDTVAEQSIPAGSIVEQGTTVTISAFPTGEVGVPAVAGLTIEEAARLVTEAGLEPEVVPLGDAPNAEAANRVDRSEPTAGTTVTAGSVVSVMVYGGYVPPPEDDEGEGEGGDPPAIAGAGWDQPWRGTIKLTLIVGGGGETDLDSVLDNFDKPPEPPRPASGSSATGALGATAEAMAGAGAAVGEAVGEAIADAMGEAIKMFYRLLQRGVPMSLTFVAEQGGYRVAVPGTTAFTEKFGEQVSSMVPLLLPEGGTLLRAKRTETSNSNDQHQHVTFEIRASPDWDRLEVIIAAEMSRGFATGGRRSMRMELTGTLEPGLYPSEQLEADFNAALAAVMPTQN